MLGTFTEFQIIDADTLSLYQGGGTELPTFNWELPVATSMQRIQYRKQGNEE